MGNEPDINYTLDLSCVDLKGQSKGNCLTFSLLSWALPKTRRASTLRRLSAPFNVLVSKLNRSAVLEQ